MSAIETLAKRNKVERGKLQVWNGGDRMTVKQL